MPSALPIWHWHPLAVGLFVFAIDFGAIVLIRLIERTAHIGESSKTFLIGDSIALPLYMAMAAVVVQQWEPQGSRFYLRWRWHAGLIALGVVLALVVDGAALVAGTESVLAHPTPSKVYHTLVFVPMFYLATSALLPMLTARQPRRAATIGLAGLTAYVALAASDLYPQVFGLL